MIRKMTCIVCPNGCELEAEIVDGKCISVSGNLCPKGAQYAAQEVEAPKRTIESSVAVKNGVLPLVSVRLNRAVPKEKLFEVMARYYIEYEFSRKVPSVPFSPKDAGCWVHDT